MRALTVALSLAGFCVVLGCGSGGDHNPPPETIPRNYLLEIKTYVTQLGRTPTAGNLVVLAENLGESKGQQLGEHAATISKLNELAAQLDGKFGSAEGKALLEEMVKLAGTLPGDVVLEGQETPRTTDPNDI